jgi:hypothetical protein
MTCVEIDRLLSEGTPVAEWKQSAAVAGHLRTCTHCERLLRWSESPVPDPGCGDEVVSRVRMLIHADLKPVSPLPATSSAVLGTLALAASVVILHALAMGASGWTALSSPQIVALGGLFLAVVVLAAISLLASLRPASRQMVPPFVPVLLLPLGFALVVSAFFSSHEQAHFFADGIGCLAGGAMIAVLTGAVSFSFSRRGYSLDWGLSGALIGTFSGAVALLALQFSCPDHDSSHLLVWHGLAMLAAITGGYLAGRHTGSA